MVIPALFVVSATVMYADTNHMKKDVISMRRFFAGGYNEELK